MDSEFNLLQVNKPLRRDEQMCRSCKLHGAI